MPPKREYSPASNSENPSNKERFHLWRDIRYAKVVTGEIGISEKPFEATLQAATIGQFSDAGMSRTADHVTRISHNIQHDLLDAYMFIINLGPSGIHANDAAKDTAMNAGGDQHVWANLVLPKKLLNDKFAGIADRQGILITSDNAALRLLRNYLAMLEGMNLPPGSELLDHVSDMIVELVGLATGAERQKPELAATRGLRAVRLQAVLKQLKANYRNPALSASLIGLQLGLSARYVQDLLATTGTSFSEHIRELRLQDAKAMLADPHHQERRIGDLALEVGFSDISYFNRSFKRRFGCSPRLAR